MSNQNFVDQIFLEMQLHGISPESSSVLVVDGKLHRYWVVGDKPGKYNGWYVIHAGEIACALFGSWKNSSVQHKWFSKSKNHMSPLERFNLLRKVVAANKLSQQAKQEEHKLAAKRALHLWTSFSDADPMHPYLVKKRIPPFTARQTESDLVLSITDCANTIRSLQYVDPKGNKHLLYGGAKKGHFISVSGCLTNDLILISEGFATGATIAKQYPNACVIAAIDAGNLEHVAVAIREFRSNAKIIICADDDRLTNGNPGATKGRLAANAAGASFFLPPWPYDAPEDLTDFNDLACWLEDKSEVSI